MSRDKQILILGQYEAEASNQSIACEVEAIPIEPWSFSVNGKCNRVIAENHSKGTYLAEAWQMEDVPGYNK